MLVVGIRRRSFDMPSLRITRIVHIRRKFSLQQLIFPADSHPTLSIVNHTVRKAFNPVFVLLKLPLDCLQLNLQVLNFLKIIIVRCDQGGIIRLR
jgi:hypothetical protein